MAVSRSSSEKFSMGTVPTMLRVTSLRSFVSRHSRSCIVTSVPARRTACEYALQRVRKYCQPSVVPPAAISGRRTGVGLGLAAWLCINIWPLSIAAVTIGAVSGWVAKVQPG